MTRYAWTHITHGHSSSLGTLPAQSLEQITDQLIGEGCEIITLTEVYTRARHQTLFEKGFKAYHAQGANCGVMWDDVRFDVLYVLEEQVTDRVWFRETGAKVPPQKAIFLVLEDVVTGARILWIVNHFPPHTEGGGGEGGIWNLAVLNRVVATQSAIAGIQKRRRELVEKYDVDAVALTADWNLNIARTAVRAWFRLRYPHMIVSFPPSYAGKGTLGKRVIDFSMLLGFALEGEPKVRGTKTSDHRFWTQKLRLVGRKRRRR